MPDTKITARTDSPVSEPQPLNDTPVCRCRFDPQFNPKKLCELFCKVTMDSDLLAQEHPNNQNSEMVYEEMIDLIMRCARIKVTPCSSHRATATIHKSIQSFLSSPFLLSSLILLAPAFSYVCIQDTDVNFIT